MSFETLRDLPGKRILGDIRCVRRLKDIEAAVAGHSLVRTVDRLPTGKIRLETAFLYPDGGSVDLFAVRDNDLSAELRLTDLAETMGWLLNIHVKPWLSRRRQGFVADVLELYGVEQRGGELCRPLSDIDQLMEGAGLGSHVHQAQRDGHLVCRAG